jgi:foldase protein PrsA
MRQHKKGWLKWGTVLLSIAIVGSLISGCGSDNKTVATYDGGKIKQAELDTFTNVSSFFNPYMEAMGEDPAFTDKVLKQLAAIKVLSGRASDASKKDGEKQTKEQMQQFDEYLKQNKVEMEKQMKELNITRANIQDYIKQSLIVMADLESKVTDKQLQDSYNNKLKEDPNMFDIATVSHILIATKDPTTGSDSRSKEDALKRAKEVKTKLDQGGDFAALAKEYSDDPGSKDNGGTYENAPTLQWDPDFRKAIETLSINKVSDPVETQFGYHIMKVSSKSVQSLDQVKDVLKQEVTESILTAFIEKDLVDLHFESKLPAPSPSPSPSATTTK